MANMTIEEAIQNIFHSDSGIRVTAFDVLTKANTPEARQAVLDALQSEDGSLKHTALYHLIRMGGEDLLDILLELMRNGPSYMSATIAEGLASLGEKSKSALYESLQSEDARIRRIAAGALSIVKDYERAIPALLGLLFYPPGDVWPSYDEEVSAREVIDILHGLSSRPVMDSERLTNLFQQDMINRDDLVAAFRDDEELFGVMPHFVKGLFHSDRLVRAGAAWCLWNERGHRGEQPLYHPEEYVTDQELEFWVPQTLSANDALAALSDQEKKEVSGGLIDILRRALHWQARLASAWCLSQIREIADSNEVVAALRDEHNAVRWMAARALVVSGRSNLVELLLPLLADERDSVRWAAVWTLGRLGDQSASELLARHLTRDVSPYVRMEAAQGLGALKHPAGLPLLRDAMSDPDEAVSRVARYAAARISPDPLLHMELIKASEQLMTAEKISERVNAAIHLRKLGDLAALPALLTGLRDDALNVREAVVSALEVLAHPLVGVPLLEAILIEEPAYRRWENGSDERYEDLCSMMGRTLEQMVASKVHLPGLQPAIEAALGNRAIQAYFSAEWVVRRLQVTAVNNVLQALEDPDPGVRNMAAAQLAESPDARAVPLLIRILSDGGTSPAYAVKALARIATDGAILALSSFIRHGESIWRDEAARELKGVGSRPTQILRQALRDNHESVRDAARYTLLKMGAIDDRPTILEALRNGDEELKIAAAEQIGELQDASLVQHLIDAMDEASQKLRLAITTSIGKIGDPASVPYLLQLLDTADQYLKQRAIYGLVQIGGEEALRGLIKALEDQNFFVQESAIHAIGEMKDNTAIPFLKDILINGQHQLSEGAATALWRLGTPEAHRVREEGLRERKMQSRE